MILITAKTADEQINQKLLFFLENQIISLKVPFFVIIKKKTSSLIAFR